MTLPSGLFGHWQARMRQISLLCAIIIVLCVLAFPALAARVTMISNTDNCFSCETIYEICKDDTKDDSSAVSVSYLTGTSKSYEGSKDTYLIKPVEMSASRPIYGAVETAVKAYDNKTGLETSSKMVQSTVQTGTRQVSWTEQAYVKEDTSKVALAELKDGECYKLAVKGSLRAGTAVDNVLKVGDESYPMWAWWNNTYSKRLNITLVNNYTDTLANYPVSVTINTSDSSAWGDCSGMQVVHGELTPVNWWNSTSCGSESTVIWFRANISASSNSGAYAIYYANASAPAASMRTNESDIKGLGAYKGPAMDYYWPMDEASGNAGSVGVKPDSLVPSAGTSKVTNGSCKFGNCFNTAGTGRLDGPNYAFVPTVGYNNTLECWVKPNSLAGTIWMFGNDNGITGSTQFHISSNRLTYQIYDGIAPNYPAGYSSASITATGVWIHVVGRYNSSGTFFATYINGIYDTEGWQEQGNDVSSGATGIAVGSYKLGATAYSDAVYDECAIWSRPLTNVEIRHHALYYNIASSSLNEEYITYSLAFTAQVPSNLTSFNFVNKLVNITYGFTGMNASAFNIQVNSNGSSLYWLHVNGSSVSGNQSHSCTNTSSSSVLCQLDDNEILPATYNINPDEHEHNLHSMLATLSGSNDYYKVGINNVSCTNYGWLEFMVNGSGTTPFPVIYCNSSYTTGSPATSLYCTQIASIPANQAFNHSHSPGYAGHHVVPFGSSISGCLLNGIYMTPKSYIVFRGGAGSPVVWGTLNSSNPSNMQLSNNNGNTWTNQPGVTADLHIHQLESPTDFYYTVCGIISSSELPYCGLLRTDRLELVPLPPTQASISDVPEYIERFTIIQLNWTPAVSPNGYAISYNLTLRDNATLAISDLYITNATTQAWNASAALGRYVFWLRSFDSTGMYANDDTSNSFTICQRNYTCTKFHTCTINNISACEVVADLGCGFAYPGNLSDFDILCAYLAEPPSPTLEAFDLTSVGNVAILLIVALLWLGVMALAFVFNNMAFAGFGFFIGIALGLMFAQVSIFMTLTFMLLNIFIMLRYGSRMG